jgi:hypothetical protein
VLEFARDSMARQFDQLELIRKPDGRGIAYLSAALQLVGDAKKHR